MYAFRPTVVTKPSVSRIGAFMALFDARTLSRAVSQRGFVPIFAAAFRAWY